MPTQVTLGCFEPKLKDQLKGLKLPARELDFIQRDADAVTRLAVRGILTQAETNRARKRVVVEIKALIKRRANAKRS
jgi:hypothetical protein